MGQTQMAGRSSERWREGSAEPTKPTKPTKINEKPTKIRPQANKSNKCLGHWACLAGGQQAALVEDLLLLLVKGLIFVGFSLIFVGFVGFVEFSSPGARRRWQAGAQRGGAKGAQNQQNQQNQQKTMKNQQKMTPNQQKQQMPRSLGLPRWGSARICCFCWSGL